MAISESMVLSKWEQMGRLLLDCGSARDPKALVVNFLTGLKEVCDYDQALVLFMDANGKVCGQHRYKLDQRWSKAYLEYYVYTSRQQYSCYRHINEDSSKIALHFHDWSKEDSCEFLQDYIHPLKISCSCGIALYDMDENVRTAIGLDKLNGRYFSESELILLNALLPHVNSLHRNFYYQGFNLDKVKQATIKLAVLTKRENEIVNLMCQGVSPTNITRMLHISRSTTNSHIAHIYEKLHVSSQQELISLLLNM